MKRILGVALFISVMVLAVEHAMATCENMRPKSVAAYDIIGSDDAELYCCADTGTAENPNYVYVGGAPLECPWRIRVPATYDRDCAKKVVNANTCCQAPEIIFCQYTYYDLIASPAGQPCTPVTGSGNCIDGCGAQVQTGVPFLVGKKVQCGNYGSPCGSMSGSVPLGAGSIEPQPGEVATDDPYGFGYPAGSGPQRP